VKDYTEAVEQKEARYSARVIEESSNPSNMSPMSEPHAHGIIHGCCGDTMEIYLRLNGDRIEEATFTTDGRESAIACASVLTKAVPGLSLGEAGKIRPEDVIAALDGLPKARIHCAHLTVNTLRQAIGNWHAGGSEEPFGKLTATSTRGGRAGPSASSGQAPVVSDVSAWDDVAARAGDLVRQGYH